MNVIDSSRRIPIRRLSRLKPLARYWRRVGAAPQYSGKSSRSARRHNNLADSISFCAVVITRGGEAAVNGMLEFARTPDGVNGLGLASESEVYSFTE